MAAIIISDTIKDARGTISENKIDIIRIIVVGSLSGPAASRVLEAYGACGVIYGQSHPNVAGLIARNFDINPLSDSVAEVIITYSLVQFQVTGELQEEYQGSLQTELVDEDVKNLGQPIKVYFWNKAADIGNLKSNPKPAVQGLTVNLLRPNGNLTVTRYVVLPSDDTSTFTTLEDAYLGRVNATTFKGRDTYKWLMTAFNAKRLATRNYELTLNFAYNPKAWYSWGRYVDPYTGLPPATAKKDEAVPTRSNGWGRVEGYYQADYNALYTALKGF